METQQLSLSPVWLELDFQLELASWPLSISTPIIQMDCHQSLNLRWMCSLTGWSRLSIFRGHKLYNRLAWIDHPWSSSFHHILLQFAYHLDSASIDTFLSPHLSSKFLLALRRFCLTNLIHQHKFWISKLEGSGSPCRYNLMNSPRLYLSSLRMIVRSSRHNSSTRELSGLWNLRME